jgi:hypothetical protein
LQENTAAKLFCSFSLTEKTPDHCYFSELRKKIGTEKLAKFLLFNFSSPSAIALSLSSHRLIFEIILEASTKVKAFDTKPFSRNLSPNLLNSLASFSVPIFLRSSEK